MIQNSSRQELGSFRIWQFAMWLIAAMILSIVALPHEIALYRPDLVLLVLIFWSMRMPAYLALVIAFVVGLFQDVLHFELLGTSSLAYSAVIFVLLRWFAPAFTKGSLTRQFAAIFVLCSLSALLSNVVAQLTQNKIYLLELWVQPLAAALLSLIPLFVFKIRSQNAARVKYAGR